MIASALVAASGMPAERLHLDDVIAIGLAERDIFRPVEQIIITPAHAEPALRGSGDVARRVGRIGQLAEFDRGGIAHAGEQDLQTGLVVHRGDFGQIWLQRGGTACFDRGFVHPATVEIADLFALGAIGLGVGGKVGDDLADLLLGLVGQHDAVACRGAICGDLGALVPIAVGVGPEIVARFQGALLRGEIDAERAVARTRLGRGLGDGGHGQRGDGDGGGQPDEGGTAHDDDSPLIPSVLPYYSGGGGAAQWRRAGFGPSIVSAKVAKVATSAGVWAKGKAAIAARLGQSSHKFTRSQAVRRPSAAQPWRAGPGGNPANTGDAKERARRVARWGSVGQGDVGQGDGRNLWRADEHFTGSQGAFVILATLSGPTIGR